MVIVENFQILKEGMKILCRFIAGCLKTWGPYTWRGDLLLNSSSMCHHLSIG